MPAVDADVTNLGFSSWKLVAAVKDLSLDRADVIEVDAFLTLCTRR
jgi:hypothetical protein